MVEARKRLLSTVLPEDIAVDWSRIAYEKSGGISVRLRELILNDLEQNRATVPETPKKEGEANGGSGFREDSGRTGQPVTSKNENDDGIVFIWKGKRIRF